MAGVEEPRCKRSRAGVKEAWRTSLLPAPRGVTCLGDLDKSRGERALGVSFGEAHTGWPCLRAGSRGDVPRFGPGRGVPAGGSDSLRSPSSSGGIAASSPSATFPATLSLAAEATLRCAIRGGCACGVDERRAGAPLLLVVVLLLEQLVVGVVVRGGVWVDFLLGVRGNAGPGEEATR